MKLSLGQMVKYILIIFQNVWCSNTCSMCVNTAIRPRICRQVRRRFVEYLLMVSIKTYRLRVTAVSADMSYVLISSATLSSINA